ncbi:MAG: GIY-YIG nuclease family protein [Sphingobacteriales bacterium]|nr:GIY-YIG nuclease family protein [Sphingobacteriales bacterium]
MAEELNFQSRRYLYLIKESVGVSMRVLLLLLLIETAYLAYLLSEEIYIMFIAPAAAIVLWWFSTWVYGIYKIGITNNLEQRLTAINNGNVRRVYYVFVKKIDRAGEVEQKIHDHFDAQRRNGEWFVLWFWEVAWLWLRYFRVWKHQK